MNIKIAVIGRRETVMGFTAVGTSFLYKVRYCWL